VKTKSGTSVIARSCRHRSTATGSGPASITTAACAPAESTSASPCPTSHATKIQFGAGHPEVTDRTGISTITAVAAAAASERRGPTRTETASKPTVSTSSDRPPAIPPGQPTVAPCSPPKKFASQTSQRHGHPARSASRRAGANHSGDTTAAAKPTIVVGATTGSASTFAGMATRLTRPEIAAMIGAVTTCAAAATATDSAMTAGTRLRRKATAHAGASTSSAAVASTDMAKPALPASSGSHMSSPRTVADKAGSASRGRPLVSATSATAAINAARRTLGDGRATTTKTARTSTPEPPQIHGRTPNRRNTSSTEPIRIEQFVPLTATKWVSPASRKCSAST
jgi:hypothetical protein